MNGRFRYWRFAVLMVVIWAASTAIAQTGTAWPEADKLFHSDPRWLGADGAYSIDLGHGRVLWMLSDSFVAHKPGDDRRHAAFLHNTVAIQNGYDPSHATIKFYWRTKRGEPSEMFPSEGRVWMWPGSGIRIGNRLLLFCTRVTSDSSKDSLGFKSVGWNAYWVTNPDAEPAAWKLKVAARVSDSVVMATEVLREDGYIYLFGLSDDLYLARLSVEAFAKGRLSPLEWWSGGGWQTEQPRRRPILRDAGTELSVQRDPDGTGFIEVTTVGFGAADLVLRRAPGMMGPWSAPVKVYRPPESDEPAPFVYAGKSHAELKGADLVLTYVANSMDDKLENNMNRYFPRFVKVDLHGREQAQRPH